VQDILRVSNAEEYVTGTVGAIPDLLTALTELPGIGPKSAERIAHYLLAGERETAYKLKNALQAVLDRVQSCSVCFNLTEGKICSICQDPRRDAGSICVVETPRDVALFERIGSFRGLYHVLGGRLAPLDGMGPDKLSLNPLADRVKKGGVREVILATSPTLEGDGTALFVSNLLANSGVNITRLARGLPSGSSLELANPQVLADALDGRKSF
jgi:recombination protein RecR